MLSGVTDMIHISTSDTTASLPNDAVMVNGTITFAGDNNLLWGNQGTFTVTATDTTTATILPVTSPSVVVGP